MNKVGSCIGLAAISGLTAFVSVDLTIVARADSTGGTIGKIEKSASGGESTGADQPRAQQSNPACEVRTSRSDELCPSRDLRFQHADEIFTGRDVVDIYKKPLGWEGLLEASEKRLSKTRLIPAAIVDENLAGHVAVAQFRGPPAPFSIWLVCAGHCQDFAAIHFPEQPVVDCMPALPGSA